MTARAAGVYGCFRGSFQFGEEELRKLTRAFVLLSAWEFCANGGFRRFNKEGGMKAGTFSLFIIFI